MSNSRNLVLLNGYVGAEPEVKTFDNGGKVSNVSLATSLEWKDKETGEDKKLTEWHRLVFRNKLAEIAEKYIKKGSRIDIVGMLKTRSWGEGDDKKYITEVIVKELMFLDSNSEDKKETSKKDVKSKVDVMPDDDLPF